MLSTYLALKLLSNSQECESFLNRQISMALLCFKTHNSQCTCMKITRQKCFCLWAAGSVSCVLAQCLVSSCNILVSVLLTACRLLSLCCHGNVQIRIKTVIHYSLVSAVSKNKEETKLWQHFCLAWFVSPFGCNCMREAWIEARWW